MQLGTAWPLEREIGPKFAAATSSAVCPARSSFPPTTSARPSRSPSRRSATLKSTLDKTPELAADIMDSGITLAGGGALLKGIDERLHDETGMPIRIASIRCTRSHRLGPGAGGVRSAAQVVLSSGEL